jgi:hypothetical protein
MGPSIGFGSANKFSGATNPYLYGIIRGAKESPTSTNDYAGYLAFYTLGTTSITNERLRITSTGNVGIGTTTPDQLLAVAGTIHSKEVKVDLAGWPDYVFKPKYKLPSLANVKAYIDQNHHLPDMPSESEVAKDGINLGELVKLQTKKIEELTLYLLEKDQQVKAQEQRLKKLEETIKSLTNHKH